MSTQTTSQGTSIVTLLTVAFVVLKLTKVIDWSWWWVLSPIWISFSFVILVALIVAIPALIQKRKNRKKFEKLFK